MIWILFVYFFNSCPVGNSQNMVVRMPVTSKFEAAKIIMSEGYKKRDSCLAYFEKAEIRKLNDDGTLSIEPLNYDFFKEVRNYKK